MISHKKLLKLARKWQKTVALRRKRITLPSTIRNRDTSCSTSAKVERGHFVVYSADQTRLLLPLEYLSNEIIRELFDMAEEEFGLPSNGPLILPCEAELMEYGIALIKQQVTKDRKSIVDFHNWAFLFLVFPSRTSRNKPSITHL